MKTTFVLLQRSLFELSRDISWAEHSKKGYIIRDPANANELLYLSESEYNKLIRVMLSTETSLDVIATPRDTPISINRKFPNSDKKETESPFLEEVSYPRNFILNLISGWSLSESMIKFERNFEHFLPRYYLAIISWLGHKSSPINNKFMRRLGHSFGRIHSYRGINQVILYLKISSIATLQYIAGTPMQSTQELGQRIKLIHGLPSIIPSSFRSLIRSKNILYIRVIISLLHSYKGMIGKYGKPDLSSITAPRFHQTIFTDGKVDPVNKLAGTKLAKYFYFDMLDHFSEPKTKASGFWKEFNPKNIKCNFSVDTERLPIRLTAGPNHRVSFVGAGLDALVHTLPQFYSQGIFPFVKMVLSRHSLLNIGDHSSGLERLLDVVNHTSQRVKRLFPDMEVNNLSLGKLAIKNEAAGKIRVFAISDYWTQFICAPIHESMFKVLSTHSSDATFDQLGRVSEFMRKPHTFIASYDLKAATDLIPIQLYEEVLGPWMDRDIATAWVKLLTARSYIFEGASYRYSRGQPMGTLSSWAGLAIVHHYLVYLAAQRAGFRYFRDYLVLGDDIVIGNEKVARQYTLVCKDYGVTIGFAKSFVSNNGFFQFASQNIVKEINISPISLKEIFSISMRDKYSSIFSGITSSAGKTEFVNRMIGKGFINIKSPFSLVRSIVTPRDWRLLAKDLSKGVFPSRIRDTLLMMLSSPQLVKLNTFSISQLMAIIYGDINYITKNKVYEPKVQLQFISDLVTHFDELIKNKINELMLQVSTAKDQSLGLIPWSQTTWGHLFEDAVLNRRTENFTRIMAIRKSWKLLSTKLLADIASNDIHHLLWDSEQGTSIEITYLHVQEFMEMLAELESIKLGVQVFNDTQTDLTSNEKVAPRVRAFLSMQQLLFNRIQPQNI